QPRQLAHQPRQLEPAAHAHDRSAHQAWREVLHTVVMSGNRVEIVRVIKVARPRCFPATIQVISRMIGAERVAPLIAGQVLGQVVLVQVPASSLQANNHAPKTAVVKKQVASAGVDEGVQLAVEGELKGGKHLIAVADGDEKVRLAADCKAT